jgi:hypothetical protein
MPLALTGVGRRLLARAASDALAALEAGGPVRAAVDRIRALDAEARSRGMSLGLGAEQVSRAIESALRHVVLAFESGSTAATVGDALCLLGLGTELETTPDLWAAQNTVARLFRGGSTSDRERLAPLMSALGFAPGALVVSPGRG